MGGPDTQPIVARLRAAGCVFAEDEAAQIEAAADDADDLERLVAARCVGTPLEQLLGRVELGGVVLGAAAGVFVPRQRSLLLVEEAVRRAPTGGTVLDLCCGGGGLLAVVLTRRTDLLGHAADLDPVAVAGARRNLATLGPRAAVHAGDLYDAVPPALAGTIDVLVANAPYVPTPALAAMPPEARDHEPRLALDGGDDGLDVHRRIAAAAPRWLAPGGCLLIEVADTQVATALALLADAGLAGSRIDDESRGATVVLALEDRAGS